MPPRGGMLQSRTMNKTLIQTAGLVLALGLAAPHGFTQPPESEEMMTGAELLDGCEEGGPEAMPTRFCMEFVFGLVQTVTVLQEMMPDEKIFCVDPQQVELEDVTMEVTEWLQANPVYLDQPAFLLVSEALSQKYPCAAADAEIL